MKKPAFKAGFFSDISSITFYFIVMFIVKGALFAPGLSTA